LGAAALVSQSSACTAGTKPQQAIITAHNQRRTRVLFIPVPPLHKQPNLTICPAVLGSHRHRHNRYFALFRYIRHKPKEFPGFPGLTEMECVQTADRGNE
jgi:hypothetical protein